MKLSPKTKFSPILLLGLTSLFVSFNTGNSLTKNKPINHFSYETTALDGPEHWHNYHDENTTENQCKSTKRQSPINIIDAVKKDDLQKLSTSYFASNTEIVNNGHTIQFNYNQQAYLTFNKTEYSLLQFHFHVDSEHTVNNKYYPLEAHLVHKSSSGSLAVIGIFFELGEENEFLAKFINDFPESKDEKHIDATRYNIEELLPENENYYTYSGSLTTPPCSEIVSWIVMETPVKLSQEQLDVFTTLLVKNNRPIQPLGEREVYRFAE